MLYDTICRHNQALSPSGLETLPSALHALNAVADDWRRADKRLDRDAATLLLTRNLADVADRDAPSANDLRLRCAEERIAAIAAQALLDPAAKRTFHYQARCALARLAEVTGLDPDDARINTAMGRDGDEGTTELRHADLSIRVVPRSFLPDSEITFNRCRVSELAIQVHRAPIAELLDAPAFQRRLTASIVLGAPRLAADA